jgi:beta-ketoacyl-acyl-carrier-protein synthase II
MEERIVITGMGTINPLGHGVDATWKNLINGVSAVGPITAFDTEGWNVKLACEVSNYDPAKFMDVKDARRRDRFEQFGVIAAKQALQDSGLQVDGENAYRIGSVISSAVGGIRSLQEGVYTLQQEGFRHVSPFVVAMMMPNGAASMSGIELGLRGPSLGVVSACASGADSLGVAWMLLRSGMMDAVLAGGAEATITSIGVGAFDRAMAISRQTDPELAPRPFDKERDGLVMGEGSAVLVLETESHARARGANIYAELAGYGATADAYHITAPRDDGSAASEAIRMALRAGSINLDEVGYINAHGTGTVLNDAAETQAIKRAFGERAYEIPVSGTKAMTGHMMGATGALEIIICALAMREGAVPPTVHYHTPDPACDLDYVPNEARELKFDVAISNALGFGGHNTVLAVRRYN